MSKSLCNTNRDIPREMILGNLVFMNLADMRIEVDELSDIFKANSLPESYIRKISPADAFRRATSFEKNKSILITDTNGAVMTVKIEVDEVKSDAYFIKRIIGIKRIDQAAEDISYIPVAEAVFVRSINDCVTNLLVPSNDPNAHVYEDVCNNIVALYGEWSQFHNKTTVRNIINRIVESTHPINLMPTGLCKFIPASSSDTMYNLKNALGEMGKHSIKSGGENVMEIIPVIDTDEQRSSIEKCLTVEMTNDLAAFVNELKDVLTNQGTLSPRKATAYVERYKSMAAKVKDYESLLGVYMTSIGAQLNDVLQLVMDNKEEAS